MADALKTNQRNIALDYAKGLGILIVVFAHLWRGLQGSGLLPNVEEHVFFAFSSTCTILSMPAFFFASGVLYGKNIEKKHGLREFAGKFDAIFYPYLVWSLIIGLSEVLGTGVRNGSSSITDLPSILWQPRGVFWFLYSLILAFAVSEILVFLAGPKWGRLLTVPVALGFLLLYPPPVDLFSLPVFLLSYLYFATGMLLARKVPNRQFPSWIAAGLLLLAIFAAQYVFHIVIGQRTLSFQSVTPNASAFAIFSGILFFALCYSLPQNGLDWLANLGSRSMDIYLLHILFIATLRIFLQKIVGVENPYLYIALGMVVGVWGPLFLADLIRKAGGEFLFSPPAFLSLKNRMGRGVVPIKKPS